MTNRYIHIHVISLNANYIQKQNYYIGTLQVEITIIEIIVPIYYYL